VRDGQASPHRPRLVVSRSTCPPLSPSTHANRFIILTAVINTHQRIKKISVFPTGANGNIGHTGPDKVEAGKWSGPFENMSVNLQPNGANQTSRVNQVTRCENY
jgi:hypothetical protein